MLEKDRKKDAEALSELKFTPESFKEFQSAIKALRFYTTLDFRTLFKRSNRSDVIFSHGRK